MDISSELWEVRMRQRAAGSVKSVAVTVLIAGKGDAYVRLLAAGYTNKDQVGHFGPQTERLRDRVIHLSQGLPDNCSLTLIRELEQSSRILLPFAK